MRDKRSARDSMVSFAGALSSCVLIVALGYFAGRVKVIPHDGDGPAALGDVLGGREDVSGQFTHALSSDNRPVLVTFEDSARGLHFDGVDLVIAVGLPNSASSYLHVAGRTGRRLGEEVAEGTVVTVIHPKAVASLESWANQLGQVVFEELVT